MTQNLAIKDTFDLSVLGMPAVVKALNDLPSVVSKRLVRSALRAGGKIIHRAVLAAVPRATGALARSIKLRSGGMTRGTIQMRIFTGDLKTLGYRITKQPGKRGGHPKQGFPPAAIEFGYVRGGRHSRREYLAEIVDSLRRKRAVRKVDKQTTGGTRVPPRSFIRGPLNATRKAAIEAIGKDLAAGLEELGKAGARQAGGGA